MKFQRFAHGLFHALNRDSFEDAPWWLYEGMAELYESGEVVGQDFKPSVDNWREHYLKPEAINPVTLLAVLQRPKIGADALFDPESSTALARARLLCQYLDEKEKLWPIYWSLRPRTPEEVGEDPAGLVAIQAQPGSSISAVSADFARWVREEVEPVSAPHAP